MPNIEVEQRGLLTKNKFCQLQSFFAKKAKFLGKKNRFSLIYFQSKKKKAFQRKENLIDLRLRITNKKTELVLKYGKCTGRESRKEFCFEIDSKKFSEMVEFLHLLGFSYGVIQANVIFVYRYQGIDFSLVEVPSWGYYFEAEILTGTQLVKKADRKIKEECAKLNLEIINENDFYRLLDDLNNRRGYRFDFDKQSFSEIKKRFIDFF